MQYSLRLYDTNGKDITRYVSGSHNLNMVIDKVDHIPQKGDQITVPTHFLNQFKRKDLDRVYEVIKVTHHIKSIECAGLRATNQKTLVEAKLLLKQ